MIERVAYAWHLQRADGWCESVCLIREVHSGAVGLNVTEYFPVSRVGRGMPVIASSHRLNEGYSARGIRA